MTTRPAFYVCDRPRPPPMLVMADSAQAAADASIRRRRDAEWTDGECDGTDFRAMPTGDPRAFAGERFAAQRDERGAVVPRLDRDGRAVVVESWRIDVVPAEEMPRSEPIDVTDEPSGSRIGWSAR